MYSAQYWNNQGMPANKIVIGMATYGQSWTISGASGVPPPNTPAVGASQVRFNLIKFHSDLVAIIMLLYTWTILCHDHVMFWWRFSLMPMYAYIHILVP